MQTSDAAHGSALGRVWPGDRTMDKQMQELRNETRRRRRALKKARITYMGRRATIDCTVLNLSDRGACLKVESPFGIPASFDLLLDNAPVRSCRVTWRKATQIGVEFA
jgi:PilZ domain